MAEADPTLPELLRRAIESRLADVNVSLPGIVQSYDEATRTCTVQIAVRNVIPDDDGEQQEEDIPPLQNVPVCWPACAAFSLVGQLAEGDTVLLVFSTRSPTEWRRTGEISTPADVRRHGLYCAAIPGYLPKTAATPERGNSVGNPGGLRLTFTPSAIEAGTGAQFVALAGLVANELNAIKTALQGPNAVVGGGGGTVSIVYSPGSVASSNLKADP